MFILSYRTSLHSFQMISRETELDTNCELLNVEIYFCQSISRKNSSANFREEKNAEAAPKEGSGNVFLALSSIGG